MIVLIRIKMSKDMLPCGMLVSNPGGFSECAVGLETQSTSTYRSHIIHILQIFIFHPVAQPHN